MASEIRGDYVVGLQPYDRMPNDWLRMVARVFASYCKAPLEHSIVAYISGLNLTKVDESATECKVAISDGQAFVDDQFIGFLNTSYVTFSKRYMNVDEEYSIALRYEWINQMPPPEPHFLVVPKSVPLSSQEYLSLGYAIKRADGSVEIIDTKEPWYICAVNAMTGDTEISPEDTLPYLIRMNGPGSENDGIVYETDRSQTIDIGWALDFHDNVGNMVDYNIRLHTLRNDDGYLYINNRRIFTFLDPRDPNFVRDPNDTDDAHIEFMHNLTLIDDKTLDEDGVPLYPISDSGKACISFKTVPEDPNDTIGGSTICYHGDTFETSIANQHEYGNFSSTYNELRLTNEVDVVTINGWPIWHGGNLESSGKNIYFLGVYSDADPADFPDKRLDGSPLHDGDTLYNDNYQAYFFWHTGTWVQVGRTESAKQYEFEAIEGQTSVKCHYNPDFIMVSVSGIVLTKESYVANDGEYIIFNRPLQEGEMVTVHTVIGGQNIGIHMEEIADTSFINLQNLDVLRYQEVNGNGQWVNGPVTLEHFHDIQDVAQDGMMPNDGQIPLYHIQNDPNDKPTGWYFEQYPRYVVGELSDVFLDQPQEGQILQIVNDSTHGMVWKNMDFHNALPADLGSVVGSIMIWTDDTPPAGYLECNGATLSRTTYSKLFSVIGTRFGAGDGSTTFQIPDLRGEFVRGWDNGRGKDLNRLLGSNQDDAIRDITGSIGASSNGTHDALFLSDAPSTSGAFGTITGSYKREAGDSLGNAAGYLTFAASRSVPTANENRPKNVALMYVIKY